MKNYNTIGLNWVSFLSYALTGALIVVPGLVLSNVAKEFELTVPGMSSIFTFLHTGILISIALNAWLIVIIPLRRQLIFGFILMLLAIVGLMNSHNLTIFSICMLIMGVVSGITMSIGTFIITHMYEGKQRGSKLLITDSFFSIAGFIFSPLTATIIGHNLSWHWVYICIGIVYLVIFILTLFISFPKPQNEEKKNLKEERWGVGVILLSITALCYILGQIIFITWVPEYAKTMGVNIIHAGYLASGFWAAYTVGMWAFSFVLRFFDLQRLLAVLAGLSALLMFCFINTHQPSALGWAIIFLGFSSSAIYSTIITLGSLQTKKSSPKLVNFILVCGTVASLLTFPVSRPIVAHFGFHAALVTANALYAIVFVMCVMLGFFTKHRQHSKIHH
jgi:TsgA-like MFS transporter